MIELTVALPLYNTKNIAWLALEGLCNQINIDFKWELIIVEEHDSNMFGLERIAEYKERLINVNCCSIRYVPLSQWVSLPTKWKTMGELADVNSKVFMLQAADCYSEPMRLYDTFDIIAKQDYDWLNNQLGYFYHIFRDKLILYDGRSIEWGITDLNMAFKTHFAKNLLDSNKLCGIDGWLFQRCKELKPDLKVKNNISKTWNKGIDTHGWNNISKKRGDKFMHPEKPFFKTRKKIKDILPKYIIEKLKETNDSSNTTLETT